MDKKKVLLTSVFRPYSGKVSKYNRDGDEEWLDYLASRLTREPGPFTMSDYASGTSLQLIGSNLDAEVTLLVHPSLSEFIEEVKKKPDFVGISFLIKGLGKLFPMIAAVRKYSPESKVIIGGFGTMLHNIHDVGADFVCKGEGVSFFRSLIGQNPKDPVQQPLVTGKVTLKCFQDHSFIPGAPYAELTHGFGCPHKCDFCTTSAFFGYLHIPFSDGPSLYGAMAEIHDKTGIDFFRIYEEDLCLYKRSLKEWGGRIRDDRDRTLSWGCFSTIRSLTSWDLEELVSMGLGHVWIGVESANSDYSKSKGRNIGDLFDDLHSLGVTTTGSMIFGLDHHPPENVGEEIDHLIGLYPSTAQIGTLMPAEGTEVRARMEKEGRLLKSNYYDSDLLSEIITHPHFEPGQIRAAALRAYDDFYIRVGPAIHRIARTWLSGARRLGRSANEGLKRRAEMLAFRARATRPIFLETVDYLPSPEVREQVRETLSWMEEDFGKPDATEEARARLVEKIFALEVARREVFPREPIEPNPAVRRWSSGRELTAA